jgi:hypothetical protein
VVSCGNGGARVEWMEVVGHGPGFPTIRLRPRRLREKGKEEEVSASGDPCRQRKR